MNRKRLTTSIIMFALTAALAAVGWVVLPPTVVVQISTSGAAGNSLPKALALLLPLVLSGVFSFLYARGSDRKYAVVPPVASAVIVITMLFNS